MLQKEKELGSAITFTDIVDEVGGIYPKVMVHGDVEAGAWSCGLVAGLIHDIPTVQALMDRIIGEANALVRNRLPSAMQVCEEVA